MMLLKYACCSLLATASIASASASADPLHERCNDTVKQRALYLDYHPTGASFHDEPVTSLSVTTLWNSTEDIVKSGHRGIFAAHPVVFGDGFRKGYFGSQSPSGQMLLSIWDHTSLGLHAVPVSSSCRRHDNDGQGMGVQCQVPPGTVRIQEGTRVDFTIKQTSANTSAVLNLTGEGGGGGVKTVYGAEWTVSAVVQNPSPSSTTESMPTATVTKAEYLVGTLVLEDTYTGLTRFQSFHEHIGCVLCDSFYESEIRVGPYNIQPGNRRIPIGQKAIDFIPPRGAECKLYEVDTSGMTEDLGGNIGVQAAAQISTGPGTGSLM